MSHVEPMIELQHVTKLYGKVIGVNDISLSLDRGAYGLLGPNGSGKSTLLNLITGQLKPTIGTVKVLGSSPRNNAKLFRSIGYFPGSEGLYANVSGFDWVAYHMELHGMTRSEAAEATEEAMELVGMAHSMERPISSYSRGMRQRTKLAQAVGHDPELLILDEPFNGLDPVGRHEMTMMLRRRMEQGKSLLLASHILHEVESLTHSFLLICGGRLLASGTSEDVHEMLVGLPNELSLRCNRPQALAALIVQQQAAQSLSIDDHTVTIATRDRSQLITGLPRWLEGTGIEVTEMHSADESLQALFNSLMKLHRGEL